MKIPKLTMALMLLFIVASCSSKKKEAYHGSMDESIEMSESSSLDGVEGEDADIVLDEDIEVSEEGGDEIADSEGEEVQGIEDEENQDLMVVDVEEEEQVEIAEESSDIQEEHISLSEEVGEYTVQKGDTLMEIAFKLYGDFGKWKDIKSLNPDINGALKFGSIVKYHVPESSFKWTPKGNPYLVMRGDTLSTISQKVYDKASWWPHIHENNKPMIKDPDQIYAGFTLYTLPESQILKKRELASQE